jgi:hypothetical protein
MMAAEEWTAFKIVLRYAILPIILAVAVMAVETFSVAAIQAAPSTKIEAIGSIIVSSRSAWQFCGDRG